MFWTIRFQLPYLIIQSFRQNLYLYQSNDAIKVLNESLAKLTWSIMISAGGGGGAGSMDGWECAILALKLVHFLDANGETRTRKPLDYKPSALAIEQYRSICNYREGDEFI